MFLILEVRSLSLRTSYQRQYHLPVIRGSTTCYKRLFHLPDIRGWRPLLSKSHEVYEVLLICLCNTWSSQSVFPHFYIMFSKYLSVMVRSLHFYRSILITSLCVIYWITCYIWIPYWWHKTYLWSLAPIIIIIIRISGQCQLHSMSIWALTTSDHNIVGDGRIGTDWGRSSLPSARNNYCRTLFRNRVNNRITVLYAKSLNTQHLSCSVPPALPADRTRTKRAVFAV